MGDPNLTIAAYVDTNDPGERGCRLNRVWIVLEDSQPPGDGAVILALSVRVADALEQEAQVGGVNLQLLVSAGAAILHD